MLSEPDTQNRCLASRAPWSRPAGALVAACIVLATAPAGLRADDEAVVATRRNFIDAYIFDKIERDGVAHAAGSSDAEFLRRVTLDLTGQLPQPDAVRAFLADPAADKRDRLIDTLCTSPAWLDRWTYWFGDLFEICSAQLGEGRNPFREYVYNALRIGLPYDKFVREMLTATASINSASGPANLLVRSHVDGAADVHVHHEDTCDEIAVKTCRVFLGVDLECVSCHNGAGHLEKINLWLSQRQRSDVWRQASFFGKIRIVRPLLENQEFTLTNEGTGYNVEADSVIRVARAKADITPTFILTGQRAEGQLDPRQELARMLTAHPQFARATVNLIWAELMGQGIVDPPLAFDLARQDPQHPPPAPWTIQPSHPELLDALARDFVEHHYDLRHLMRAITQSAAYQLSAQAPDAEHGDNGRYFARRHLRRLSAEMLYDAISQATGVTSEFAINGTNKKIKSAAAAYSPEDVGGPAKAFLSQFGQSNRDKAEPTRSTSILQAAALMNSPLVKERVGVQAGGRLTQLLERDPPLADQALIEELFLATLTRTPSAEELAIAGEMLAGDRKTGAEDLLWVLLNKFDFLFY